MKALGIALACSASIGFAACGPSVKVGRITPIANLQHYGVMQVRVASSPGLENYSFQLERAILHNVQQRCGFHRLVGSQGLAGVTPDLIVDMNIMSSQRGGGLISNPNVATMAVTMVLSDGADQSLLGSADITGKSSSVMVNDSSPEGQAIDVVAKQASVILTKSGCVGPRVARPAPAPTPTPTPTPGTPQVDPAKLAQAEALNDQGKGYFRAAQIAQARDAFAQAMQIAPDPRYGFNLCLAHEALGSFDKAVAACQQVLQSQPEARLADKAKQRLEIIAEKRG